MSSSFFAMMSRMKYINRWALMRNTFCENISEHSLETAMLAHGLAVIGSKRLGKDLDASKVALMGMYHDASEILTGDMPTPVKYNNETLRTAYKSLEAEASCSLLGLLPEDMREEYRDLFCPTEEDAYLEKLVKAADKLSALIKCIEEDKAGNHEFSEAYASTLRSLKKMELPELDIFMDEFLEAYGKTLDEL